MCLGTCSFAAPFSPTPLEISVRDEIFYEFGGSEVNIPVDVSGKPAKCWLIINTRLPEAQLPHQITNGFLGWHYVNRIDTTVYVSPPYNFTPGSHTITWDGKGTENTSGGYGGTYESFGNVAPGTYDYYVWAYDDQSPRERVCNFLPISFYWLPQYTRFGEWDEAGLPLANPLIWGNVSPMYNRLHEARDDEGNYLDEPEEGANSYGPPEWTAFKFPLGSDPDDMSKLQTSFMPGFSYDAQLDACPIVFDPWDQEYFYCFHVYTEQKTGAMFKWKWVGDGNAEIVNGWGGWDDLSLVTASRRGILEYMPSMTTDWNYIMITSPGRNPYEIQHDVLYIVDFDGNKVIEGQMLDDVYFPDNPNETSTNGMINRAYACREVPYWITMGGEQTCITQVADASRLAADEGDDEYITWRNANGDYFHDSAWDPTISEHPWNCSSGAYRNINGARRDEAFFDSNGIHIMFPTYQGLNSILVYTQDGSGVAYCKFADDATFKIRKGSGQRVDTGSQFDGLYIDDVPSGTYCSKYQTYCGINRNINWVGFDSAHGVIALKAVNASGTIKPFSLFEPPLNAGDEFWVEIQVQDVSSLFGLSFVLTYDNSEFIEPLSAESGTFMGDDVVFFPNIDKDADEVAVGITRKAGQGGVGGSGTVVMIKLKMLQNAEDGSVITFFLNDVVANDQSGAGINLTIEDGQIGTGVSDELSTLPRKFSLSQNYPNPFNPLTSIEFAVPAGKSEHVRLKIYDLRGALVRTLVDEVYNPGVHSAVWDGTDETGSKVSSGVYIYRLQADGFTKTRKMLLMR